MNNPQARWLSKLKLACVVFAACMAVTSAPAQTFTMLVDFIGANGSFPEASLIQGPDGNFYGTTALGGASGHGTVFQLTPAGILTTIYSFCTLTNCVDGNAPEAALVLGTDGNFYGTTQLGGADDVGTIFKLTSTGTLTTLHSFRSADGSQPQATLVQAPSGTFYGTTHNGGLVSNFGAIFKITPTGVFTALHSFTGPDGAYPSAGLIRAADGNLYGTTQNGGSGSCAVGCGTVFKITPTGTLTTLHNFSGTDGTYPVAGLIENGGSLFGTTNQGGNLNCNPFGCGTIFRITPSGTLTTLHRFHSTDGDAPASGLTYGSDGNFYGTTANGGANGFGTVFEMTPASVVTTLHSFDNFDGGYPNGGLLQAPDGTFYGTTLQGGGTSSDGTLFSLTLAPEH